MRDPFITSERRYQGLTINPVNATHPDSLDVERLTSLFDELFCLLASDYWARAELRKIQFVLKEMRELQDYHFTEAIDTDNISSLRYMVDEVAKPDHNRMILLNLASYEWEIVASDWDSDDDEIEFNYYTRYRSKEDALWQCKRNAKHQGRTFDDWPLPDARDYVWLGTLRQLAEYIGVLKRPYAPYVNRDYNAFERHDWQEYMVKHSYAPKKHRPFLMEALVEAVNQEWKRQWSISSEADLHRLEQTWKRPVKEIPNVIKVALSIAKKKAKLA